MNRLDILEMDFSKNCLLNKQEEKLFRKIWWHIIPLLFVCYVVSILDRINIGFAQLQMKQDLGFSDVMYGLGTTVFYLGYVICEIPSNMLLTRFGARCVFSCLMILWGMASIGMMLVSQPAHFYFLRFLLGVFEAGFFPGIVWYLTFWFPACRRATVMSVFFAGVAVAGVFGGLVSGWIMRDMAGVQELYGWQWMFALEGAPAVLLGLIIAFFLVNRPREASWLTVAEKDLLVSISQQESPESRVHSYSLKSVREVLRNPYIYRFAFIHFALTCAGMMLSFWMPLMIRDFGIVDVVDICLYSAIPNVIAVIGLLWIARRSDRVGERHQYLLVCTITGALALLLLTLPISNLVILLAVFSMASVAIFSAMPIFWALPPSYLPKQTAAVGIALISSIGITSGIFSPWVIGYIKMHSGSMDLALYLVATLLLIAGRVIKPRLFKLS